MDRTEYEQKVYMICDLLYDMHYKNVITHKKVIETWNACTDVRLDVPGYWMTDAMEQWGKRHGFNFVYNVNKHNRRKNITLVKI